MGKLKDLTGQKFGKLTVIERTKNQGKHTVWVCKCECGNIKIIRGSSLTSKNTLSCGCLVKDKVKKMFTKHNNSNTRLYKIWANIKSRCLNPKVNNYCNYGGRGIKICEEWLLYENFYKWANCNNYSDILQIDRIDVNGNYEPNNCRWVTPKEQSNNKRNNLIFEYKNKSQTLKKWAEDLKIDYMLLYNRIIRNKWTFEKAITVPIMENRRNRNAKHR